MFTSCTRTLDSGNTCKSPAVRGTSLCFNHTPHENIKRRQHQEYEPFELPSLHTKDGILVAITEIVRRLAERKIKRSEADTLLHGLKFAARLMTEIDEDTAASPFGFEGTQYAAPTEQEFSSESIQETVDNIAASLGLDPATFQDMIAHCASMPNLTTEEALDAWLAKQKSPGDPYPDWLEKKRHSLAGAPGPVSSSSQPIERSQPIQG
jgi:hypothetical protein